MSLPARDEIDAEYRFDLTDIFGTPADWDDAREALLERLDGLDARADDPVESTDDRRALLEATEECYRRKQRLELYATLARNVNTGDDTADDRMGRYRDLAAAFEPAIAAVRRRLRATDDRDARYEGLDEYRYYATNLREQATYARAPAVEETIGAFEGVRTAPTGIVRAVTTEDFDPPTVERPDGDGVDVRPGNVQTELSHEDRAYR